MTAESRASRVWSRTERASEAKLLVTSSPRDIIAELGVSYRRLDYWVRCGYIRLDDATPGSGHPRAWPDSEVAVAREILRLTSAGLTVKTAADAARAFINGASFVELAPGVTLDIEGDRSR